MLATGNLKAINVGKGKKEERMGAFIESSRRVIGGKSLPYYVTFNEYFEQKIEIKPTGEFGNMP